MLKVELSDLALWGGQKLFSKPRSTSNLVRPDIERFLEYSRSFYRVGQYTNNGPLVRELESRLAKFHDVKYCVSFCNGFWALVLAIRSMALPGRAEVLMPSFTYRRLADVVSWAGLVPHFCDVDAETLAISAEIVRESIGENTALIIGVHPIVNCCNAAELESLADSRGIPLLFDGVESVYETVAGRKVGSFGGAECFSLHASKLINGFEGGYLTTNNEELAKRLYYMRGFGFSGLDQVEYFGTNAKLNEMHAAMALASLDDLEAQVFRNRERYRLYQKFLKRIPEVRLLEFNEAERCSFKNIVLELTSEWPLSREMTLVCLNSEGILARAYYSPPLHMKPAGYPVMSGDLPVTEFFADRLVLMPCGHFVSNEDVQVIVNFLLFLKEHAQVIRQETVR